MTNKANSEGLRRSVKILGVILIVVLLIFLPFVPVQMTATEIRMVNHMQTVPEVQTTKEAYTTTEEREQIILSDYDFYVAWNNYEVVPVSFDLSGKLNPILKGSLTPSDLRYTILQVYDQMPYPISYPGTFTPPPVYRFTGNRAISFTFIPKQESYYFLIDSWGQSYDRYFKLSLTLSWTETVVKYRDVSETVYKQVITQVPEPYTVTEKKWHSLFYLWTNME